MTEKWEALYGLIADQLEWGSIKLDDGRLA